MGARPARRRARPPEDQGGLAGVREDRRAARASASSATSRSAATSRHEDLVRALRRGHLRGRRADRPADGHPRRGPAGLLARHRVRRLVQRPPRLPGARRSTSPASAPSSSAPATSRSTWPRMLALTPEEIAPTDTTDAAIDAILGSGIKEIVLLARRGPAQAAFTTPELKELGELADADVSSTPPTSSSTRRARPRSRRTRTRAGTSRCSASTPRARRPGSRRRSACASASRRSRSWARSASRRSRSSATGSSPTRPAASAPEPTDERETIPCGIVFRSVGYRGVELPGRAVRRAAGEIPNDGGRSRGAARRLLRRLDQARPERRDRHEQEGRDRDGRAAARGRPRRAARTAATRARPPRPSTSCSRREASRP